MTQDSEPRTHGDPLWKGAVEVLRSNDVGTFTRPAPRLYPHQWSWDSAFIAIGLVHIDPDRALRELETLFQAQWTDGRVPHIVFDEQSSDKEYFPDPGWWASQRFSPPAPARPPTSGLILPPVQAIAAWHIAEHAGKAFEARLRALYPRLLAWHRYLATRRDPDGSGLIVVYHPWESMDNSPRFDGPLARVRVGELPPYTRRDTGHIQDTSQRPTDEEYDRFLWLVNLLKEKSYDDAAIQRDYPLLVKDVFSSGILAAANASLSKLAGWLGHDGNRAQLDAWAERGSRAVQGQWDESEHLALDFDMSAGQPIRVQTCAGFAPLLVPGLDPLLRDKLVEELFGPRFAGAEGFAFPVMPSAAPGSPGFQRRSYWRGPVWPVMNWLFWWGLRQQGEEARAADLRAANLRLLRRPT
ncbi:MAG: MGH1-like glycoside hydrolase domain-containing protein, partial [Chloroflexota bacterium]